MEEDVLNQIEQRWMRASGGPWTVLDYRIPESEEVVAGASRFEQFKNLGACSTIGEYVAILESTVDDLSSFDSLSDRFRIVVAMPGKNYHAATRRVDCGKAGAEEPAYAFAVGPDARPEDVEMVQHASSDIGKLIAALRQAKARIAELEGKR